MWFEFFMNLNIRRRISRLALSSSALIDEISYDISDACLFMFLLRLSWPTATGMNVVFNFHVQCISIFTVLYNFADVVLFSFPSNIVIKWIRHVIDVAASLIPVFNYSYIFKWFFRIYKVSHLLKTPTCFSIDSHTRVPPMSWVFQFFEFLNS